MKKQILIIAIICIFIIATIVGVLYVLKQQHDETVEQSPRDQEQYPSSQQNADEYTYDGKTKIYVLFNSHNEDTWNVGTETLYRKYRADLVGRLQLFQEYDAKLNWQSDIPVLNAMIAFENESLFPDTDGKHILQYMVDQGFSVDPHFHQKEGYSYADVAYIIEQLGVTPSSVVGGSHVFDCGARPSDPVQAIDWHADIELEDDGYIYGIKYPDYIWKPEFISGASSGGHFADDHTSGAWRPGNEEEFYEHQEDGQIIYIGEGYSHDQTLIGLKHASGVEILYHDAGYVKELAEKLLQGEIPSGQFYSALIHVRDNKEVRDGDADVVTNDGLRQIFEELEPYHEQGIIEYVTFQEAAEIWQDEFDEEPTQLSFESFTAYEEEQENIKEKCFG